MEFKGTKGKWEVRPTQAKTECGNILFHDITIDGMNFISTHRNEYLGIDFTQDKANALLISKAPEMLVFIQSLLKESDDIVHEEIKKEAILLIKQATEI